MVEIIQKWLANRLGLIPDMIPKNFLDLTENGQLIAEILENYQIINQDQLKLIKESTNSLTNYNYLNMWLRKININFTDEELAELSEGKNEQLIYGLFYQLYETLNNKNCTYFIEEKQKVSKLPKKIGRFQVTPSINDNNSNNLLDNFFIESNPLSKPIQENWDIINWHHDHLENLKTKLRQNHENYQKYLKTQTKSEEKFISFFPPNYPDDYQGLLQQQETVLELPKFKENLQKSKRILQKIQNKHQKERLRKAVVNLLEKQVFDKLLKDLDKEKEKFFDKTISEKLLKQSNYEKKMILKMFEVKLQKDTFIENRRLLNEALNREKENEFVCNLFDSESRKNQLDYYLDVERNLELHKRLYEEKLRIKAEKRRKFCEKIVYDFVDIALKFVQHKTEFDLEPSPALLKDWGTIFIKGLPILENDSRPSPDGKTVSYFDLELDSNSTESKKALNNNQTLLQENDFEIYLNIMKTEEIYKGMNIVGFIIHRLLFKKYLPPPPPPKPQLPQVEYAISLNSLNLELEISFLQKQLNESNFELIQIEDILNYCLEAYQKEVSSNNLMEISEFPISPQNKQDKQVQTNFEKNILTRKAELGSIAHEEINLGQPLDKQLVAEMFVEYLRGGLPTKINGWILLNYPSSIEDVAALEEELTANPLPKKYYNPNKTVKKDEREQEKLSKLFPNPSPLEGPPYEPYLNGFLQIEEFDDSKEDEEEKKYEKMIEKTEEITESLKNLNASSRQIVKEKKELTEDKKVNTKKFYTDQNCFFTLRYEKIDTKAIKEIVQFILTLPKKPITEIPEKIEEKIEETTNKKAKEPSRKGNKTKNEKKSAKKDKKLNKSGKKEKSLQKDEKSTKSAKNKSKEPKILTNEDKETQIPEILVETIENVFEPGEFGYIYLNLPILLELELSLANFWEMTETTFIENLKQLFNSKREILNTITPYLSTIKRKILEYFTRPNKIDEEMKKFYQIFNDYDRESLNEEQNELRCQLDDFREEMFEICDNRLKENEIQRNELIKEAEIWIKLKKSELFSVYVGIFQFEINRCVETLQLLNDYYTIVLMKQKNAQIWFEKIYLDTNQEKIELNFEKSVKFLDSIQEKAWNVLEELYEGLTQIQGKTKKKKLKSEHEDKMVQKIFNEWKCGFWGELARCRLHLELIRNDANNLNEEIDGRIEDFFNDILEIISKRYRIEINQVEELCVILEILMEIIDGVTETQLKEEKEVSEDTSSSSSENSF